MAKQVSDKFKNDIKEWVMLDNSIIDATNNLKVIRDKKDNISKDLIKYIEQNNLTAVDIQISDGKIKYTSTKVSSQITQKYLKDKLKSYFSSIGTEQSIIDKKAMAIYDYLVSNRNTSDSIQLKRLKSKEA